MLTKADWVMILATGLAALGWIFSGEVLHYAPPIFFIGWRFLSSGILLGVWARHDIARMGAKNVRSVLPAGVVFALGLITWIIALRVSEHLGVGAFLLSLNFVLVPMIAWMFGDRPNVAFWISVPITSLGLALLFLGDAAQFGLAEGVFLLSALLFALYLNLNRTAVRSFSAKALVAIQQSVVGVIALAVSLVIEDWQIEWSLALIGWFLASVLIATSGRFVLQAWAQGQTSASNVALILTLEPIWVALLAWSYYGQSMTIVQVLGCVLILGGLMASRLGNLIVRLRAKAAGV